MRSSMRVACVLLAGLLPAAARAQVSIGPALDVGSSFIFRGLTLTNRPVLQPSLTLAVAPDLGTLEVSLWGNLEPAAYDGASEISALDGSPGFTEVDIEVQAARGFGRLELAAGFIAYLYPAPRDGEAEPATTEVMASATWDAPLSPGLALYHDLAAVRGLYAEASLEYALERAADLSLRALVGYSHGQADGESAWYERDGFTHAEFGAALPLQLGRLSIEPALQAVIGFDPAARISAPARDRRVRLFAGASFGWGGGEE